ncbi:hypothetical protein D8674_032290 [Pyrus ussuriensis x Pyrus communis]|uniref:Uncharacterized protein n=1 Tax=Pyrus ussuriensis x Pyrus communis TaxID=2448454 RepID=A0A5N5F6P7_9ROSA|nr:hypothetical protein D8674_032290 [Pyrus ussuriensis x Pyrus communis]
MEVWIKLEAPAQNPRYSLSFFIIADTFRHRMSSPLVGSSELVPRVRCPHSLLQSPCRRYQISESQRQLPHQFP